MIAMMERLEVNVVSVVIGALFFLIAVAWVEVLRNVVEYVFFHTEGIKDYHTLQKKLLGAIFITVISIVIIIIIYSIYKTTSVSHKTESKPSEAFKKADAGDGDFPGTFIIGIPSGIDHSNSVTDVDGDLGVEVSDGGSQK